MVQIGQEPRNIKNLLMNYMHRMIIMKNKQRQECFPDAVLFFGEINIIASDSQFCNKIPNSVIDIEF